jgi:hypothetical protein
MFRRLLLETLTAAHKQLWFFGKHAPLASAPALASYLASLRNSPSRHPKTFTQTDKSAIGNCHSAAIAADTFAFRIKAHARSMSAIGNA